MERRGVLWLVVRATLGVGTAGQAAAACPAPPPLPPPWRGLGAELEHRFCRPHSRCPAYDSCHSACDSQHPELLAVGCWDAGPSALTSLGW